MLVDELGHDGDGRRAWTLVKNLGNLLVFDADDILSIDLTQVVVDKETIPRGGGGRRIEMNGTTSYVSESIPSLTLLG